MIGELALILWVITILLALLSANVRLDKELTMMGTGAAAILTTIVWVIA